MTYQVSSFFPLGEQFALNHEQHSHWLFEKPLHKRMFAQRFCKFKRRARAQTMNEVARPGITHPSTCATLQPSKAPPRERQMPRRQKGRNAKSPESAYPLPPKSCPCVSSRRKRRHPPKAPIPPPRPVIHPALKPASQLWVHQDTIQAEMAETHTYAATRTPSGISRSRVYRLGKRKR